MPEYVYYTLYTHGIHGTHMACAFAFIYTWSGMSANRSESRHFAFGAFPSFSAAYFVFLLLLLFTDLRCSQTKRSQTNNNNGYITIGVHVRRALTRFPPEEHHTHTSLDKTRNMSEATICTGTHRRIRSRYANLLSAYVRAKFHICANVHTCGLCRKQAGEEKKIKTTTAETTTVAARITASQPPSSLAYTLDACTRASTVVGHEKNEYKQTYHVSSLQKICVGYIVFDMT